ncbi:hypothetical protein AAVH_06788 [Aphelenchoides avenae]|nr:hypothetical protein AAVH_06788 [Aphelenchus avenae]
MRRRPRAVIQGAGQRTQKERTPAQNNYDLRPRVNVLVVPKSQQIPGHPVDEAKIWTIGTATKTALELTTACSNELDGHERCHVPTVKDIDDAVTDEGEFWDMPVVTVLHEALVHMVIREKGARIAEHIGTEMLKGGAGREVTTYVAARGDMLKPNAVPSEDDFRTAIIHRYENCQVAKKALKASGHRRINFETNQQDFVDARQRRAWQEAFGGLERIIETVRAQRVHNADNLIEQKMVVIGDSTAAQLGEDLNETAKITGNSMADVIRQLSKTVLRNSVRTVLVVAGRDAMLNDDSVDTFVGQCEKLAGMLSSYSSITVYWMIPPYVSDKAEKYNDMAESLIAMLERTTFDIVATSGLRSVAEIFRYGSSHEEKTVGKDGALTWNGRRKVLEYLRDVHRFPLNAQKKEQGKKREHGSGSDNDRDQKQRRMTFDKRRSEPQFERKSYYNRRQY